MDSRFTFKDLVFVVLFLVVIAAVIWVGYQFSYQETRLNEVKRELVRTGDEQKQQLEVLTDIRNTLRSGVRVGRVEPQSPTSTQTATTESGAAQVDEPEGRIHRTNPDGSIYVYYPNPPVPPHDPHKFPDYAEGDWLIQNLSSEPKTLMPDIIKDYDGQMVTEPVLEGLVQQNLETFEYEPLLAESYTISADGKTFRFTLRQNIQFSDGTPVTADDVVFSYKLVMNEQIDAANQRSSLQYLTSCTKIDDRTVEFQMSEKYFLALGSIGENIYILPEHVYKDLTPDQYNSRGDLLVGTGPYKLQKWDRGQQITLVRNDRYWRARPTFDKLVFRFIANEQAAFQMFQDGQFDQIEPMGEQYAKFSADPEFTSKFKAYKFLRVNSGYGFIGWNLKRPMFKDTRTRQALTMLIDRNTVINTLLKGMGYPIAGPFLPNSPQHDSTLQPEPYDPERAKQLLAEDGWKPGDDGVLTRDGVKFEFDLLMGSGSPTMDRLANYIKNQFASAGIRMRITPTEFSILNTQLDDRKFDAVTMSWMLGQTSEDDPYQLWGSKSIENKGSNFISWNNKESDQLLEEARRTLDDPKRMELWHKWEKLIYDNQPYTFLWARPDRRFINGRFKNTDPYKLEMYPYDWYVPRAQQKYH